MMFDYDQIAKTIAEAEAQSFTLPVYDRWFEFAHLLDGYAICDEMGVDWKDWARRCLEKLEANPESVTVLEARLLLFFKARMQRFTLGVESYASINDLLKLIAHKTGQAYAPLPDEDIERRIKQEEEVLMRGFKQREADENGEA
ncbi:MAG: hypothetical protein HZC41_26990 [Chloroflexi bacterium]|nr:hypothetical protein [Chloroflexota bacterium]